MVEMVNMVANLGLRNQLAKVGGVELSGSTITESHQREVTGDIISDVTKLPDVVTSLMRSDWRGHHQ